MPPPPGPPPTLWGSEEHVRRLLGDADLDVRVEQEVVDLRFGSVEHVVTTYATKFGPVVRARERLEPEGRWAALRGDLAAMFERHAEARDGGVSYPAEYLVVTAR